MQESGELARLMLARQNSGLATEKYSGAPGSPSGKGEMSLRLTGEGSVGTGLGAGHSPASLL